MRYFLKQKMAGITIPIFSGPLKGKNIGFFSGMRFIKGTYSADEIELFTSLINPGDTVFDIGAHIGYMAMLVAKLAGPDGTVYAFEPSPLNLSYLQTHVRKNHIDNIFVYPYAVSDRPGTLYFDFGRGSGRGRLVTKKINPKDQPVKVISIDNFMAAEDIKPPNLIKMDIEGAELAGLKGAENTLRRYHPTILLSTHSDQLKTDCLSFLATFGYHSRDIYPNCHLIQMP